MKKKIAIFTTLLILMIGYVAWIFYMSEPKYIDNPNEWNDNDGNWIERFQIVSYSDGFDGTRLGMVIQIDTISFQNQYALVKNLDEYSYSDYKKILLNTNTPEYSIVGTGTFYHKVNHFVGFNIMFITTIIILILSAIVFISLVGLLRELLGFNPFFD